MTVATICPGSRCVRGKRRDRNGLVDGVEHGDAFRVDHGQSTTESVEIGAPRERHANTDTVACEGGGDTGGGGILGDVAALQARNGHLAIAGCGKRFDVCRG